MTTEELEAGATAVHELAEKYGMAILLTRDQEREVAAVVIKALDALRGKK